VPLDPARAVARNRVAAIVQLLGLVASAHTLVLILTTARADDANRQALHALLAQPAQALLVVLVARSEATTRPCCASHARCRWRRSTSRPARPPWRPGCPRRTRS
jgi:hypothetical protein